jgi:hypothetical protein
MVELKLKNKIYLRSRVRIRNLTVRGLRVSQWCGWGLKSSGMWHCVVRRVVPGVSKDYDGLFLDCYPWRWRHHDLSKRRKQLTQRNSRIPRELNTQRTVAQLLKIFPKFHKTWRFLTAFKSLRLVPTTSPIAKPGASGFSKWWATW